MSSKWLKSLLVAAFGICTVFFYNISLAQEGQNNPSSGQQLNPKQDKDGELDVAGTILEHIRDDHSWHLWGHTSLPLPVILKTDKGWEVFSSARLSDEHHTPVVYNGNYPYKQIEGRIKVVNSDGSVNVEESKKLYDFSITKNVLSMLISVALLLIIFLGVARAYKKTGVSSAPKGFQSFIEPVIIFIRDEVARPCLGHQTDRFMPFILNIFFFIWINNLLGIVPFFPGGANLSGNIAFTFTLALFTFVITNVNGKGEYWKHIFWMPGLPVPLKIFLMPIELLGVFIKAISLTIRLFANITAGHILVLSLVSLIFIFKAISASVVVVPFTVFIGLIELLVGFIQAFIFAMLSALYIGMAIEENHEQDLVL